ncbi:MAG: 2-isopropylmalate synthase [Kiritimatiellae bacterium]|nr:2-isopropylmalate synthase [Kiritimatiellia bacterium]
MSDRVMVFDTTLRDGEQAPGYAMNREEKVRMALQLEALGVDVLEAGFAVASPGDFDSVKAIAEAVKRTTVCSLARALEKDIDASARAIRRAVHPRIHTFIATSELHLKYKLKITREGCLQQIKRAVAYARKRCAEVEFSAEDASRTDPDFLCRVIETAIAAGATVVNIPDTVGYTTPEEFGALIARIHNRVKGMDRATLSVHCHDDLGLAVANTLAGIRAGARQAECTISGIGERAGNAALEEIVMGLVTRRDFYGSLTTGIRTEEIARTAKLLATITGVKIAPNKAIVGVNAFAHESGIHQHGVLSKAETYEIMTPESVGMKQTELVLGKHSGQHAFESRVRDLGYDLPPERMEEAFAAFKALADRKKQITDRDLVAIVEAGAAWKPGASDEWKLDSFVVNSGNHMSATAQVTLVKGKRKVQDAALGTGPIYASFRAIEKIVKHKFVLEDYRIEAVTEHRDALGEVLVKISDGKGVYRGRGVSTDVIEGSILALLVAVNRMLEV